MRGVSRSAASASSRGTPAEGQGSRALSLPPPAQRAVRPGGGRDPRQWRPLRPFVTGSSTSAASSWAPFSRSINRCRAMFPL
ncbi:hypothetical protein NDU88_006614 [Pleurodeles waltl]|uniref:Uncharacterized protein n=1 Tax=Pleurodeles waltl TaxID=8319 RepID=A0AAV7VMF3_PLEWA|nr:hypothetical protein NDU88_006614 [Pleurodeles waltl]